MHVDDAVVAELAQFLAAPDPPDLLPRRHHVTCEGRADRNETIVVPLIVRHLQYRLIDRYEHEARP